MLERVWRKGNPLVLLVGKQIYLATLEDSMEIPLKTRNKKKHTLGIKTPYTQQFYS